MNRERRRELSTASENLNRAITSLRAGDGPKAMALLSNALQIVEDCHADEEGGFHSLSEGLQATERGQHIEEAMGHLEEARDGLEDVVKGKIALDDADLDEIDAFIVAAIDC